MGVMVGSARIDERGKATGGRAGDQNGFEVSTQAWYKHKLGWIVLRAKSREAGRKIAQDMIYACDNPHIGYDQSQRNTLYTAAKPYGFDCSKVGVDCETDCSSLVRVCVCYAGITVGAFSTETEPGVLLRTGAFVRLDDAKYTTRNDYLRAGDILVTRSKGHTVVVLNDGLLAGDEPEEEIAPANPTQPDGSIAATTSGNYWLREKPGLLGRKIGVVPDLSTVLVYGRSTSNPDWYGIRVEHTREGTMDGAKGYISCKALPGLEV